MIKGMKQKIVKKEIRKNLKNNKKRKKGTIHFFMITKYNLFGRFLYYQHDA